MPTGRRGRVLAVTLVLCCLGRPLPPGGSRRFSTFTPNARLFSRTGRLFSPVAAPRRTSCRACARRSNSCARLPARESSPWMAPAMRLPPRLCRAASRSWPLRSARRSAAPKAFRRRRAPIIAGSACDTSSAAQYATLVRFLAKLDAATPPLVIDNLHIHGVLRRPGTPADGRARRGSRCIRLPRRR